jgi:hypothetical protein
MRSLFPLGEEATHVARDPECPECLEGYPEACECGGLIHAGLGEPDPDETEWPATRCDRCGRAEEDLG